MLTFVKSAWIKPLWTQLSRLTGERAKELDRLRDEFVDPEQLRGLYIEPHLQDRNPADAHQDDLLVAARQLAFERVNEFFQGKLPLEKDGRHQMFILSDAGMGKTSLLLMIKLMHLTSFWPKGHNCELFKLDEDSLKRMCAVSEKGKTVLLLDALDEDRHAWKRIRERLEELLQISEDFRRVIISCRTQFFPTMEPDAFGRAEIKVFSSGYHCPVLYLSPFSDKQVSDFIEKKFCLTWQHRLRLKTGFIRRQRKRAVQLLDHMQDLRMRPMLLQHIDKLLAINDQQKSNAYTIYQVLIHEWLDREVRKLRGQHDIKMRVPERKELFYACLLVAEHMERRGRRVIAERDLQELIHKDKNIRWLEQFELGGRSLLNRNSDRAFRFSHYTIQEFLLACCVANDRFTDKIRATDQLVRFLVLANCFGRCGHYIDFDGFNWKRYVESHGFPVFRDRLSNNKKGPAIIMLIGGYFRMGDIQGIGKDDERPLHGVQMDNFSVGCYPVTFAEYDAFCEVTGCEKPEDKGWGRGQRPVINISWQDAEAYCQWLSRETGHTYRLPTEAEWEYACRAGSETIWCFGDDKEDLGEYAWYEKNSNNKTHSVGRKKANAWGLYDMHGNVWEWCDDWYHRNPVHNPIVEEPGVDRVIRGGSWYEGAQLCRSAFRDRDVPAYRAKNLGFRCVRVQDESVR